MWGAQCWYICKEDDVGVCGLAHHPHQNPRSTILYYTFLPPLIIIPSVFTLLHFHILLCHRIVISPLILLVTKSSPSTNYGDFPFSSSYIFRLSQTSVTFSCQLLSQICNFHRFVPPLELHQFFHHCTLCFVPTIQREN